MTTTNPPQSSSFASDVLKLVGGTAFAKALVCLTENRVYFTSR